MSRAKPACLAPMEMAEQLFYTKKERHNLKGHDGNSDMTNEDTESGWCLHSR